MINRVTDFKYKSWKDGSNLSGTDFNRINLVFGHNGAGKSALTEGIRKEHAKTNNSEASVREFSDKYVDKTLLLKDGVGIRGIVSNFGVKDVGLEEKIIKNNERIAEITKKDNDLIAERDNLVTQTETLIKEIVARRKDKNRKINNKPSDKTVREKVMLWVDDYTKASKDFPNEDYNQITGGTDFSVEKDQVNAIYIAESPVIDDSLTVEAVTILQNSYQQLDVPDNEIVSWLQSGVHIHEDKTVCEFCGNQLDIKAIKEKVDSYANDAMHKAAVQLESYRKTLNTILAAARSIQDNKKTYIALLGLKEDGFAGVEEAATFITKVDLDIAEKLKDMTIPAVVTSDLSEQIKLVMNMLSDLINAKTQRKNEIAEKINRMEVLVKGAIGFEIQNSATVFVNLDSIDSLNTQIAQLGEESKDLRIKNATVASQKSDLGNFAAFLNRVLVDLSLNFKLELNDKSYVLRHVDGPTLKVSDISDGERNLLALVYFYYEMLEDTQGTLRDEIELIIIDDPISSLDDGNKFYITELVKSILNQGKPQVFVLTHSWDDFCNLTYGQNEKPHISIFEITKNSGVSDIRKIEGKRLDKPYRALYKEIYLFSQKDINAITDQDILHMPNVMRRVLEEYIKFVVDVDFATARRGSDISKALFGEEIAKLPNTTKQKLDQLLSICNILSHKAGQPKNGSEVHKAAKFLMNSFKEGSSKHHHLKMVE